MPIARRRAQARRLLTALVADAPVHPRAHLGLGYIAALEGDDAMARIHYRDAIAAIRQELGEASPQRDVAGLNDLLRVAHRALASVRGSDLEAASPPDP